VDGVKERVVITLNDYATKALLKDILDVDQVITYHNPYVLGVSYSVIKNNKEICQMNFDEDTPIEDRVMALRVTMRMEHGNDSKSKGGSTP
jgi:hypothetical protein